MGGIEELYVVQDSDDQLANSPPVCSALGELEEVLEQRGVSVLYILIFNIALHLLVVPNSIC